MNCPYCNHEVEADRRQLTREVLLELGFTSGEWVQPGYNDFFRGNVRVWIQSQYNRDPMVFVKSDDRQWPFVGKAATVNGLNELIRKTAE